MQSQHLRHLRSRIKHLAKRKRFKQRARALKIGSANPWVGLEALEQRQLLDATLTSAIADFGVAKDAPDTVIDLKNVFDDDAITGTVIEFKTVLGNYFAELFDAIVPNTVNNFLNYVNDGDLDDSIVHRSVPGFVIQGGAFKLPDGGVGSLESIPTDTPVVNEFTNWAAVSGADAVVTQDSATVQLPAGTDLSNVQAGNRIRLVGRADGISNQFDFFDIATVDDANDTVTVTQTPMAPSETIAQWFIFPDVNLRGTLSPPKLGGNPDSATSGYFVNLANNAANLDTQNEGFAAFGQVLFDGMDVVDAIAALQVINAGGSFTALPVTEFDDNTIDFDELVVVNSVAVVDDLTYEVVSNDNPDIVTVSVDANGQLTLAYTQASAGVASITVRATDLAGNTLSEDTFEVAVGLIEVQVGDAVKFVEFTDNDGTTAKITVSKGTANLTFLGATLQAVPTGKGIVITATATASGQDAQLSRVDLLTATNKTTLKITGKGGDGQISLKQITGVNLDVKSIDAKIANLTQGIDIDGALLTLKLNNITDSQIDVGLPIVANAKAALKLQANDVTDSSITSLIGLTKVKTVANWIDSDTSDSNTPTIDAPWFGKGTFGGDILFDLMVSGTGAPKGKAVNQIKTVGNILGGQWNVTTGDVGKIDAKQQITGLAAHFENSQVNTLSATGDLKVDLHAVSIKNIISKAKIFDSTFMLSQAFGTKTKSINKLSAAAAIENVVVRTLNNIGSVIANNLLNSRLFAGFDLALDDAIILPDQMDFEDASTTAAGIGKVTLKDKTNMAFTNSTVVASSIGTANLGMVAFDNNSVVHGLAAETIKQIKGLDATGQSFKITKLDIPNDVADKITDTGVDFEDLVLSLFASADDILQLP